MRFLSKSLILLLLFILVIPSLSLIKPTNAQSIPKPAIPEFTIKYVDNSYNVPESTVNTIDPFTGNQSTRTNWGYYVQNKSIVVVIKNQQFTPYTDSKGNSIQLFYNVTWKGYYGSAWDALSKLYANQDSSSEYCNISLAFSKNFDIPYNVSSLDANPDAGGVIDFQVKAYIGYEKIVYGSDSPFPTITFNGAESSWSNTQTITIPESKTSSLSPTIPELPITASLVAILSIVSLLLVMGKRKLTAINH
jgi:hypothetical protein